MTLLELSDLLKKALVQKEAVSLPGMGRFVVESTTSMLVNEGKTITPPSKKLVFESSNSSPDSLLASLYSSLNGVSHSEAETELAELLRIVKKDLIDNAFVELPDFGTIKYKDGNFVFESSAAFNAGACYYSLEPLAVMPKRADEEIPEPVPVEEKVAEEVNEEEKTEEKEREVVVEVNDVVVEKVEKKRLSGYKKVMIVVGVVLAVLLLAVAVLVIFKEQFMPLLENLLYSEEELEILKNVGR